MAVILPFVLLGLVVTPPAEAQTDSSIPPILRNEAVINFPNDVVFHLELDNSVAIVDAALAYDVEQVSCLEANAQVPIEVDGATLEWTWVMSRSGNPPPGAELWWEWTLTDAGGRTFTTPRQTVTLADDRFKWRVVEAEGVRLHWYRGEEVGPMLLDAAVAGLNQLQTEMGIELQNQVNLFIYGSASDMRQAVLYIQDWAGGVAFSDYNTILIGVPPNIAADWGRQTVRHELAHLVIGQFGRSCIGGHRPTWLNEGLAVYAEGRADAETLADIESGIEDNLFEPVRSLNGAFPAHGDAAGMAYSQSYSLTRYLLVEHGPEKMQTLLLTLAEGKGYDEALQQVYEFNVDGLELRWREAIGAPPRTIPPTPTRLLAANIPTAVPMSAPVSLPTPEVAVFAPPTEPERPSSSICGLGLMPLALLAGLSRRKKGTGR
ncbi:MAG: hypothetical protein GY803_24820 [Chloroflexi bacterium]|nr:hypothetical protein [Chloroflexota bacterium]